MEYLAVLGRQPKISLAELESLYQNVQQLAPELAVFDSAAEPEIRRLGGTQKIATRIDENIVNYLKELPKDGKITLGVSDFTTGTTAFKAQGEALRLKRILVKNGHSVRVVPNKAATLSSATSYHNHLFDKNKIELIKYRKDYYRVIQIQNIDAYVQRDQARPARDAKVGMLPPKLAQILINLCGALPEGSRVLDPFCGTGVVLQEATLMGYIPYGTDLNERMVEYTKKNLEWLLQKLQERSLLVNLATLEDFQVGDATDLRWNGEIDAVACECFLGQPMSQAPAEIKLKQEKQECSRIILGFLRNLETQIKTGVPVVMAVPAWLRTNGEYERLNLLDEIKNLRYNVVSFKNLGQEDLLYHREGQVVAREIIVLRKK